MVSNGLLLQTAIILDIFSTNFAQIYKFVGGPQCCDCEISFCESLPTQTPENCADYRAKCLSTSHETCVNPGGYTITYEGNSTLPCQQECDLHPDCVGFATRPWQGNTSCRVYGNKTYSTEIVWLVNEHLAGSLVSSSPEWFFGIGGGDITFGKITALYNGQVSSPGNQCFRKARCANTTDCDSLLGAGYICREGLCQNETTPTTEKATSTTQVVTHTTIESTTVTRVTSQTEAPTTTTVSTTIGALVTTITSQTEAPTTSTVATTTGALETIATTVTTQTDAITTATTMEARQTFIGALGFTSTGLTSEQVVSATKASLAQEFGITDSWVTVIAVEEPRRLKELREARRLAATWKVEFTLVVPLSYAAVVEAKVVALKADLTTLRQALKTNLQSLGVSETDATIEINSFEATSSTATSTVTPRASTSAASGTTNMESVARSTAFLSLLAALSISTSWLPL